MEKRKWNAKNLWPMLAIIGVAVVCFCFFQLLYPYHFFFKGQNQLFLMSWSYVGTLFDKPAWAACLAGEFLTQFYYYDVAGAVILTLSLTLLFWLAYKSLSSLKLKDLKYGKQIILIAALFVAVREASCHLHYGYTLSSTFALIGGLSMFLLLRRLMTRRWPWALLAVLTGTLLCYWLFGYGVWPFLLLSALTVWIVTVPVAAAFIFLLPSLRSYYNLTFSNLCQYPGVERMHTPDFNRETDLHMIHSYQTGDWDDVVETAESDPVLNSLKVGDTQKILTPEEQVSSTVRRFIYNLVQAQRGNLPDVLMTYFPNYLGTFTSMIGTNIPMMMFMNLHEFYYAIGDISRAERGAFMSCVSVAGNRNAYDIKRLAECALVRNDQKAAEKFLGLLRQTIPYREWAENAPNDERYRQKAQFINLQDSITPSEDSHNIMVQLLESNPENEVALDYMLCSLLLKKDIDGFKHDYDQFCTERPRIKKLYQEALCIWLMKQQATEEEWQKYIKDEQVKNRLKEYMTDRSNTRFADTYWFYFDFFNLDVH
ncbi:MAG: hypothetical protein IKX36_02970 [Prevotella sp.]|nr:hypothetical protein [Prevotella sp.]